MNVNNFNQTGNNNIVNGISQKTSINNNNIQNNNNNTINSSSINNNNNNNISYNNLNESSILNKTNTATTSTTIITTTTTNTTTTTLSSIIAKNNDITTTTTNASPTHSLNNNKYTNNLALTNHININNNNSSNNDAITDDNDNNNNNDNSDYDKNNHNNDSQKSNSSTTSLSSAHFNGTSDSSNNNNNNNKNDEENNNNNNNNNLINNESTEVTTTNIKNTSTNSLVDSDMSPIQKFHTQTSTTVTPLAINGYGNSNIVEDSLSVNHINGVSTTTTTPVVNGLSPIKNPSSGILPTPMTSAAVVTSSSTSYTHPYQQNLQRYYSPYVSVSTPGSTYPGSSSFSVASTFTQPQFSYASAQATPSYTYGAYASAPPTPTGVTSAASYYTTDPAALAKEVAQKNYANALKMAAAAANPMAGKPLNAAAYTGMSLNKAFTPGATAPSMAAQHAAFLQAHQMQQAHAAVAAAQMRSMAAASSLPGSGLSTPVHTPTHSPNSGLLQRTANTGYFPAGTAAMNAMMRSQALPMGAHSAQYAAMAQQPHPGFFYPGMMPAPTAAYPFAAMGAMPTTMTQAQSPSAPGTALVLNPYKKMKTS